MKRRFAPSLFALSLCALLGSVRTAGAQGAETVVATSLDSVASMRVTAPNAPPIAAGAFGAQFTHGPVIQRASAVRLADVAAAPDAARSRDLAVFQGRDWKMPTSRTLMISGVAAVAVGLLAVKGDAGAIIAMTGGGVAVYGLYLHYNR